MKATPLLTISCGIAACAASFFAGLSFKDNDPSSRRGSAATTEVTQSTREFRGLGAGSSGRATASERGRSAAVSATAEAPTFASILTATDSISRMEELLAYTRSLTAGEFPEALAQFQKDGLLDKDSTEYDILLTAWAKVDPQGALTGIAELRGSKMLPILSFQHGPRSIPEPLKSGLVKTSTVPPILPKAIRTWSV